MLLVFWTIPLLFWIIPLFSCLLCHLVPATLHIYYTRSVEFTATPLTSCKRTSFATFVQVIGLLLATVYFLWLGMMIFESFVHIQSMNAEYIFIMVITLITIIGAMSALYTGAFAPDQARSAIAVQYHIYQVDTY